MVLDTEVEITIGSINKNIYEQKGYKVKLGDKIIIPIKDLYVGSRTKVNVKCQNPDCGIIKPMPYENYIRNINSTDIHIYYCNKCNYLKKIALTNIKQTKGTLTREDAFYWQHEENRIKEFLKYIEENKSLENMNKKDYGLYNAIFEYEGGSLEFIKKLNLDIESLFVFKKPDNYYTKDMVIDSIRLFIKENDRFPFQQEMISFGIQSNTFNKFFKDYSECKKEMGYYNKDDLIDNRGDVNRSFYELYTSNFLIGHGLGDKYKREEHPFKEFDLALSGYRSDFSFYPENEIPIHIEVWGDNETIKDTSGYYKDYLGTRKEKERLYELYSNNITLISIEPSTFTGNFKSIDNKLYNIFKDYLDLEYKTIDIELLLPYNSMTEDEMFVKLMECSKDKNSLPYRKDVSKIKGGFTLLKYIDKRYGGMGYFAEKYNLNISHRTNYWTEEKVFECFDYMIVKYNKIFTGKDYKELKDNKLKGLKAYLDNSGGVIYCLLNYAQYIVKNNEILNNILYKYLLDISQNKLYHCYNLKPQHQLLAKQIIEKYNNQQLIISNS